MTTYIHFEANNSSSNETKLLEQGRHIIFANDLLL